jgi:hypothetical protein
MPVPVFVKFLGKVGWLLHCLLLSVVEMQQVCLHILFKVEEEILHYP